MDIRLFSMQSLNCLTNTQIRLFSMQIQLGKEIECNTQNDVNSQ